jgi:hypothetical protein
MQAFTVSATTRSDAFACERVFLGRVRGLLVDGFPSLHLPCIVTPCGSRVCVQTFTGTDPA